MLQDMKAFKAGNFMASKKLKTTEANDDDDDEDESESEDDDEDEDE